MAKFSFSAASAVAEVNHSDAPDGAGIYFWDIVTDVVYTDTSAAALFGFSEEQGKAGQSMGLFLDRIHPEDRPRIAEAIRIAMDTGNAYHVEYRVCRPDLTTVTLVAIGQCFRNAAGEPCHYAGLLFDKPEVETETISAVQLCLLAYEAALAEGNEEAADHIVDAIAALEGLSGERLGASLPARGN